MSDLVATLKQELLDAMMESDMTLTGAKAAALQAIMGWCEIAGVELAPDDFEVEVGEGDTITVAFPAGVVVVPTVLKP